MLELGDREATSAVTVFDHALPDALLTRVADAVARCRFRYGWHSNRALGFSHWQEDILDGGLDNTADLSSWLELDSRVRQAKGFADLWWHMAGTFLPGHGLLRYYLNGTTYGTEGYPHRDTERAGEFTTLVYMNQEWKKEWAGETVFFDQAGEIVKAVLPRYGRVIIFPSEIEHCARGVSRTCPALRVSLVIKSRPRFAL